jgi:hypothetical protein
MYVLYTVNAMTPPVTVDTAGYYARHLLASRLDLRADSVVWYDSTQQIWSGVPEAARLDSLKGRLERTLSGFVLSYGDTPVLQQMDDSAHVADGVITVRRRSSLQDATRDTYIYRPLEGGR